MRAPRDAASVWGAFEAAAALHPTRPFLAILEETAHAYCIMAGEISYGDMADAARHLTERYRSHGYGPGLRVGVLVENRPAYFRHWLALNALGCSVVPINPDLRLTEISYLVGHSEMVAAVVIPQRQDDMRAAAAEAGVSLPIFGPEDHVKPGLRRGAAATPPDAATECALLYTSGTTGRPKGCVLDNTYFLNSGRWYADAGGLMPLSATGDRMLTPLPLFHMNAMATSTMAMIVSGGCLIVLDRFHPKTWWDSVRASRATVLHYLGVMPPMLMQAPPGPDDTRHSVRFGFGAGVDRRLHAPFEARFGFPLIEAWAMTETGGGVVIAAANEPRHVGTNCFGTPGSECAVRVVGEDGSETAPGVPGELLVRRAGADPRAGFFRQYLKDPDATREAWEGGWFHTGDVVARDADGTFRFVDRRKNVIRRSGENISAIEVESVLLQHDGVSAAAVAATPDEVRGDEVFACIVARHLPADAAEGAKLAEDIVKFCLSRLAYYKAPGYVAFVDALPLTSTQKIQRGAMKEMVEKLRSDPGTIDTCAMKRRGA